MRRVQKMYFVLNMATEHWAAAVLSKKQRRLLIFDGPCILTKARGKRVLSAELVSCALTQKQEGRYSMEYARGIRI